MINTIIFDFGGVILNLNFQKTIDAFAKLGMKNAEELYTKNQQSQLFLDLEKGSITPEEFRFKLKQLSNIQISDDELDSAWNALLLDLPLHRVQLIEKIKRNYPIYLLSNTNSIHYDHYLKDIQAFGYQDYDQLFHHAVFSFKIGLIKPHREIWEYMINTYHLDPNKTLFIDDSIINVKAAQDAGFHAYHLKDGAEFAEIFNENGALKLTF